MTGVLGAVSDTDAEFGFLNGLAWTASRLRTAMAGSATGDRGIQEAPLLPAVPCLLPPWRLSTIALSCCFMLTLYSGDEGWRRVGRGFAASGPGDGKKVRFVLFDVRAETGCLEARWPVFSSRLGLLRIWVLSIVTRRGLGEVQEEENCPGWEDACEIFVTMAKDLFSQRVVRRDLDSGCL